MKFFFGVFCKYTIVTFAQTKQIYVFWKVQSLAYLEMFLFYQYVDFWRFCGDFCKKNHDEKNFFFQNFFFKFLKIPFSEHNSARFDKKNWFFFQMSNVSACVVRHKLNLYETKSPHLRNTWIPFLWPKCLYYCHTSHSKYKS